MALMAGVRGALLLLSPRPSPHSPSSETQRKPRAPSASELQALAPKRLANSSVR